MSISMSSDEMQIIITRPAASTKLGIRLMSEHQGEPPSVIVLNSSGAAATSTLRIGDVILNVDGQPAQNSEIATQLFARAGTTITLRVRRGPRTITIARNKLGLGISVDTTNRVTAMYDGSAAQMHGGLTVGDRIIGVNGRTINPGTPLAPHIPPGNSPFQLSLIAAPDAPVNPLARAATMLQPAAAPLAGLASALEGTASAVQGSAPATKRAGSTQASASAADFGGADFGVNVDVAEKVQKPVYSGQHQGQAPYQAPPVQAAPPRKARLK